MHRAKFLGNVLIAVGCGAIIVSIVLGKRALENRDPLVPVPMGTELKHCCGVESLCYLAAYWEARTSPDAIRSLAKPIVGDDGGITLAELRDLCSHVGVGECYAVEVENADLDVMPVPFVVHIKRDGIGHFVVCSKISETYVQLIDPLSDDSVVMVVPRAIFDQWFSNHALLISRKKTQGTGV